MARGARAAACAEAVRAFPQLKGVQPSEERRGPNTIFTFRQPRQGERPTPAPVVRVTVDAEGRVVRVVASR